MKDKLYRLWPLAAILIVSIAIFKIEGFLFFLTLIFMSFPCYLILEKFDMDSLERVIFSIILGVSIFPGIVYYIGFMTGSLRLSAIITFFLFICLYLIAAKIKNVPDYHAEIIIFGMLLLIYIPWLLFKLIFMSKLEIEEPVKLFLDCMKEHTQEYCKELMQNTKY